MAATSIADKNRTADQGNGSAKGKTPRQRGVDTGATALLETLTALGHEDETAQRENTERAELISSTYRDMLQATPNDIGLRAVVKTWLEYVSTQP